MVNLEKKSRRNRREFKVFVGKFQNEKKDQEMVYNVSNLKTGINGF